METLFCVLHPKKDKLRYSP